MTEIDEKDQARLKLALSMAETEGKLVALTAVVNDERVASSASGLAQVLTHRVTVMEETLRALCLTECPVLQG